MVNFEISVLARRLSTNTFTRHISRNSYGANKFHDGNSEYDLFLTKFQYNL